MENVEGWTSLLFPTMGKQGMEDANETQEEVRKSCKVKKLSNKKKKYWLGRDQQVHMGKKNLLWNNRGTISITMEIEQAERE